MSDEEHKKFCKFLLNFTSHANYFVPKNPSNNIYRHYGTKTKVHSLYIEDILHIYNPSIHFIENLFVDNVQLLILKIVYYLRERGYNVFRDASYFAIYVRTKHFDRKKVNESMNLYIVNKEDTANLEANKIVAICGEIEFVLLKFSKIQSLDSTCNETDYKTKKKYQ